ncbi:MAG: YgiQ family radical SAM protein [Defluviitaleaceae bacterium]|nr:YgiQ family radical SAM protein [Defluviitaleaceae bacterium]
MPFLPVFAHEIQNPDFVVVTGDAYADHPSFGAAIISRVLVSRGFSAAILPQPNWRTTEDFTRFGQPRLGFLVTGGNIDSMVNHYTVALHKRKEDAYSPGGEVGLRPNRASIVYSNKIREAYKDVPIILGGLEASLRRLAHYDYWDNDVRRSILLDAAADLLVYGMGERAIVEIAEALAAGISVSDITFIDGTVFKTRNFSELSFAEKPLLLPHFKAIKEPNAPGKKEFARSFMLQYNARGVLAEEYANCVVVQNKPAAPLSESELDAVYALPFMREAHPMYENGVPAIEEVKFSITATRGCFGGCNFCALNFHQGKHVQGRSHKSILAEAEKFTHDPSFKGYIHDVGGPTANFYTRNPRGRCPQAPTNFFKKKFDKKQQIAHTRDSNERSRQHESAHSPEAAAGGLGFEGTRGTRDMSPASCTRDCLVPSPCPNLRPDHSYFLELLRKLRELPGVKKVFIRSGIRYDYLLADPNCDEFLEELCRHHISGRLKVAPEHVSPKVLRAMNKPAFETYENFVAKFNAANLEAGKQQFDVPYLMSSHPGCTLDDAIALAEYLQRENLRPEQVQDFYPTPGTLSTCMYYTGLDPRTGKRIFAAKSSREKATQRALIQYRNPANREIVKNALIRAGRKDLIGFHERALVRPDKPEKSAKSHPKSEKSRSPQKKVATAKISKNAKSKKKTAILKKER